MQNATYIALSSQMALQRQMDVVANNLANLSTPAFKGEEMLFSQYLVRPKDSAPLDYVEDSGTVRDMAQGPISKTSNPLDIAIQGEGWFAVETPLGSRYTRNGHFQLDASGEIVTSEGYPVLDSAGQPIQVPPNAQGLTIAEDGTISVNEGGSPTTLGKLMIADFAAPQAVTPAANGLWVTDQTPQPALSAKLQQGMLEESNVQPIVEITRMLAVSRASGAIKNFLDEEDQRRSNAIDKLGQVS